MTRIETAFKNVTRKSHTSCFLGSKRSLTRGRLVPRTRSFQQFYRNKHHWSTQFTLLYSYQNYLTQYYENINKSQINHQFLELRLNLLQRQMQLQKYQNARYILHLEHYNLQQSNQNHSLNFVLQNKINYLLKIMQLRLAINLLIRFLKLKFLQYLLIKRKLFLKFLQKKRLQRLLRRLKFLRMRKKRRARRRKLFLVLFKADKLKRLNYQKKQDEQYHKLRSKAFFTAAKSKKHLPISNTNIRPYCYTKSKTQAVLFLFRAKAHPAPFKLPITITKPIKKMTILK